MRVRDAIKSPEQCEAQYIGDYQQMPSTPDGGGDDGVWGFMRETRRRVIRLEERQTIMLKILIGGFIGLLVTILGGLALQLILAFS